MTRFRPDACPIRTDSIRSDPIGIDPALSLSFSLLALGRFLFVAVFVCFGGMRVRSERSQKRAERALKRVDGGRTWEKTVVKASLDCGDLLIRIIGPGRTD